MRRIILLAVVVLVMSMTFATGAMAQNGNGHGAFFFEEPSSGQCVLIVPASDGHAFRVVPDSACNNANVIP
jgi:hypothetical protein